MEAALVGAASRFMVDKVADLLQLDEKLKTITGTKRKMEKLKELPPIIDMVIQHIESRPLMEDAVKELLKKLKYLAYDLEDVVDYYDTKVFQKKQRSKSFLRPVSDFFSADNQVAFKSRVGGMIKAITDSLDSILLQKSILSNLLQEQGSISMSEPSLNNRETHSRNSFVVIGREPEKNKIVDMLTKDDDDDESHHGTVKVIAIVGMGGLGKTTLAQHVYNDARVQDHFASLTMWKVVGAEFNPTKIMKSLLELTTGGSSVNIFEIDLLNRKLEEELSGKRFLLVLDDVWNENELQWDILKAALTCGARGSKILVTTRSKRVSSIMSSSNTTHQLQQLSRDDCLSLFQRFAFGDQAVDQNLMAIGAKVVEKCGGVPLAAISLGSMLRSTREENYWSSVLNSEIWQLGNEEDKVLAVLKLSYDALPLRSKKCFAFASLFSKDVPMEKDELIKLWIANGFIRSEGNFDAETVGEHVFDDLVLRSLFVTSQYVTECTMHDLMYDLARSVSADVYWNSYQDSVENFGNRTYHLQIDPRKFPNITQDLGKKPLYLRTFMHIDTFSHLSINLLELLSELKPLYLRALDLSNAGIREVPTSIGILIHLRYLNLSWNHIEVLPDSITLLPNLQYFNLSFNHELRELPKELGNMQNLRDLDLQTYSRFITHMPCGLSRLTNLRSLPLFIAGDKTGACSIIELENLKLHGKMVIQFSEDFKNYSCDGRKILKNIDLNELCIEFNERYDKDMFVDLCPNTSLKKLDICRYRSPQFPAWLMESQLPNLVEVRLRDCSGCEHIPPFGNLQFLKRLDLDYMNGITHLGAEFHGYRGFPSLRELSLNWISNLEEWSECHVVDQLFPLLQKLLICWCPKLKSTPRFPRIQELQISCGNGSILSCIGRFTSLSVLQLTAMPDIASLPSGCIRNLTSLTKLQITNCRQLQSLPGDEMQFLEMLRSLIIERCDNLVFFPSEVGSLSSLCFRRNGTISQPKELVQILNSVDEFHIEICDNKVDLRGQLQYLHTLKILSLFGSHAANQLTIQNGIRKLSICCCDELESLMAAEEVSNTVLEQLYINRFSNLTTLPDWLQHLKSLRILSIRNCPRLERVPRDLKNLHMLKTLNIVGCPQLKSRCARETGEDWPIISNIPNVDIE